jgi:hypothetical protein
VASNRLTQLSVRIEPKVLELLGPVRIGIAQALDIDAAREAAFNRCLDELGSKERERERQIDLTHRAAFTLCQLRGVSDCAGYDLVEPSAAARDGVDQTKASLGAVGPDLFPDCPCGMRIFRNRFDGGFCQGIDKVVPSVDRSVGFRDMMSWVL